MSRFLISVFDYILPRFCVSCKCLLQADKKIVCGSCFVSIKHADDTLISDGFKRKFEKEEVVSAFQSLYIFEKDKELQHVIHALKYNKRFLIGVYLGNLMGKFLDAKIYQWNIDYIIPVPLHKSKMLERGYNQSYFIAKGLSHHLKLPVSSRIIKRIRYTETQTTLNKKEREENMKNAFRVISPKKINGKNILLIDDVITTGATVTECGKVLLKKGAAKVFAASAGLVE
ncbi:MAG: ComF family protein [Ignavibacteriaceae bacterium]|nr:ComF family protein [Ignavibacteriaceae bacterium]